MAFAKICQYITFLSILGAFNIALLIIAGFQYSSVDLSYFRVLQQQVNLWNLGAIDQIILSNVTLNTSQGYELVNGKFLGLDSLCYSSASKSYYTTNGTCLANDIKTTKMGEKTFSKLNGYYVYFNRSTINYQRILESATYCGQSISSTVCGSYSDSDRKWCPLNGVCEPNDYQFTYSSNKSQWSEYSLFNNYLNTPIVSLSIGINQPCLKQNLTYQVRSKTTSLIYKNDNTSCPIINGTQLDSGFLSTGFTETEEGIYSDNNILSEIKSIVPNYNSTELQLNSYKLYEKPYPLWRLKCQESYSVSSIYKKYEYYDLSYLSATQTGIASITAITIFYELLVIALLIILYHCKGIDNNCTRVFRCVSCFIVYFGHLTILTLYSFVIYEINKQSLTMLKYAYENQCSDTIMNMLFQNHYNELTPLYKKAIVGLIFSVFNITLHFIFQCLINACCCSKNQNNSDRKRAYQDEAYEVNNAIDFQPGCGAACAQCCQGGHRHHHNHHPNFQTDGCCNRGGDGGNACDCNGDGRVDCGDCKDCGNGGDCGNCDGGDCNGVDCGGGGGCDLNCNI